MNIMNEIVTEEYWERLWEQHIKQLYPISSEIIEKGNNEGLLHLHEDFELYVDLRRPSYFEEKKNEAIIIIGKNEFEQMMHIYNVDFSFVENALALIRLKEVSFNKKFKLVITKKVNTYFQPCLTFIEE